MGRVGRGLASIGRGLVAPGLCDFQGTDQAAGVVEVRCEDGNGRRAWIFAQAVDQEFKVTSALELARQALA